MHIHMYILILLHLMVEIRTYHPLSQDISDPFALYPHVMLSNDSVEMSVFLPDPDSGFYRSTRFDWSGIVGQLTYAGQTYFVPRNLPHDPLNNEHGMSLAEEFSIGSMKHLPHRYEEALPGETFVKIGCGVLRKPRNETQYGFYHTYEWVDPGSWSTRHGHNWIEFTHQLEDQYGLGYEYVKRMELVEGTSELRIKSSLTNTGTVPILQDHYNHNFFGINEEQPGPAYSVLLAFDPDTLINAKIPQDVAYLTDRQLIYRQPVEKAFLVSLSGYGQLPADGTVVLTHTPTGAGVEISGDFPLYGFNIWTSPRTLCPELFVRIDVKPGETQNWTRTYRFFRK